jgi:hypothetical protein
MALRTLTTPTQQKAQATFECVQEALQHKVTWDKEEAYSYVSPDQQNDTAADGGRTASEWSCGLHMVANVYYRFMTGSWGCGLAAERRHTPDASYASIRRNHWEIAVCGLGLALERKGWQVLLSEENTKGWEIELEMEER